MDTVWPQRTDSGRSVHIGNTDVYESHEIWVDMAVLNGG